MAKTPLRPNQKQREERQRLRGQSSELQQEQKARKRNRSDPPISDPSTDIKGGKSESDSTGDPDAMDVDGSTPTDQQSKEHANEHEADDNLPNSQGKMPKC
jgi:hypothetical protein